MQQIAMNTGEKLGMRYRHLIGRHVSQVKSSRMVWCEEVWCEVVCWDVVWGLPAWRSISKLPPTRPWPL